MTSKTQQIQGCCLLLFFYRREFDQAFGKTRDPPTPPPRLRFVFPCTDIFILSNKGGEAGDGGPGAWGQAARGPVKCAVLTGWVGALLGRSGSPAALRSKKAASLGLALGRWGTELWGERG